MPRGLLTPSRGAFKAGSLPAPTHHASSSSLDIFSSCSSSLQAPLHCIFMTRAMHRLWCAPYSREHRTRGAWVTEPGFCWPILFVGFCILGSVPCGFYATEAGGTTPSSTPSQPRQAAASQSCRMIEGASHGQVFLRSAARRGHLSLHGGSRDHPIGPPFMPEPHMNVLAHCAVPHASTKQRNRSGDI